MEQCSETSVHKNSDAGELPRRRHTTFRTRRKFEIKNYDFVFFLNLLHTVFSFLLYFVFVPLSFLFALLFSSSSFPHSSLTIILKQKAYEIAVRHVCVAAFQRFNNLNYFNKTWYNYWSPSSLCRILHFPTFTDKNMPGARTCDMGAKVRNGSHNIGFTRLSTTQRSC